MKTLKQCIDAAHSIVAFTGAGISTESGISDYRSQGGIWERYHPVTIQQFLASHEHRRLYWQRKQALYEENKNARPNVGHLALVRLEQEGRLKGVITQNIDGLHRLAGISSDKLLEIHGNNLEVVCLDCGEITPWESTYKRLNNGEVVPLCLKCNGFLKPNTISFGQNLDVAVLAAAVEWARHCDLMIAIGSTLVVEPAASLPRIAKEAGAPLVIITRSETPLDPIADLKITDPIGEVLQGVL